MTLVDAKDATTVVEVDHKEILESALKGLDAAHSQLCDSVNNSNSSEEILELGGYIQEVEEAQEEVKEALAA